MNTIDRSAIMIRSATGSALARRRYKYFGVVAAYDNKINYKKSVPLPPLFLPGQTKPRHLHLQLQHQLTTAQRWYNCNNDGTNTDRSDGPPSSGHCAMKDTYKAVSKNQYSAHVGCQDLLLDCVQRIKEQWQRRRLAKANGGSSCPLYIVHMPSSHRICL